jgi:hypothetical protein
VASDDEDGHEQLRRRLAKLAGVADPRSPAGREVARGASEQLLSALLTEIDETLIARRLTFRKGPDSPALSVEVYGRRMIRVLPPEPPGFDNPEISGKALDDEGIEALHTALSGWLESADQLHLEAGPASDDRDPLAIGLAAEALAQTWGIQLDETPRRDLGAGCFGGGAFGGLAATPCGGCHDPLGR